MSNVTKLECDKNVKKGENIKTSSNKKITEFMVKTSVSPSAPQAIKRTSSILSPPESTREVKKINRETDMEVEGV